MSNNYNTHQNTKHSAEPDPALVRAPAPPRKRELLEDTTFYVLEKSRLLVPQVSVIKKQRRASDLKAAVEAQDNLRSHAVRYPASLAASRARADGVQSPIRSAAILAWKGSRARRRVAGLADTRRETHSQPAFPAPA